MTMFLLKMIFQNSVSTCLKNICLSAYFLLVSSCIWWNRKLVVQSEQHKKKKIGRAKWGGKFLEWEYGPRERDPCNVPSPIPPSTSHL